MKAEKEDSDAETNTRLLPTKMTLKKNKTKNPHHTKDNQSKTFESIKTLQDKVLSPAGKMALVLSADIPVALLQIQYILWLQSVSKQICGRHLHN